MMRPVDRADRHRRPAPSRPGEGRDCLRAEGPQAAVSPRWGLNAPSVPILTDYCFWI
jgi:hypothetical protein